jgi:hypothetical protein
MCVRGLALQAGNPSWRRVYIALILLLDSAQLFFTCGHQRTLLSKDKTDERVRETAIQIKETEKGDIKVRQVQVEIQGEGKKYKETKKGEALWTDSERNE